MQNKYPFSIVNALFFVTQQQDPLVEHQAAQLQLVNIQLLIFWL